MLQNPHLLSRLHMNWKIFFAFHMIMAFFSLTWLVFISIQMIIDEVKNGPKENHKTAEQKLAIKWNRNYCLISNFTDEIDNFFGSVLLSAV